MKTISVKSYSAPSYPTRSILDEHPELLALVPVRWRANPVVIAALTGVCLLMATCRSQAAGSKPASVSKIAEVFVHGEGRGSFGCIATNPPVFLSEDEARQVVVEEGKKAGLNFAPDMPSLPNIGLPPEKVYKAGEQPEGTSPIVGFTLDGTDTRHNVSYEYVSQADGGKLGARVVQMGTMTITRNGVKRQIRVPIFSTAYEESLIHAAQNLRERLVAGKAPGYIGVFYDPLVTPEPPKIRMTTTESATPRTGGDAKDYWKVRKEAGKQEAAEQLRAQVRDFVAWLKAQGVI